MADIVVIEDSYEIARLIQLALGARGHKVTTYHDGLDGLEGVMARPPQLVISDVNLPGMNGFEVAKQLRERLAGRPMGIMMLTSRTDLDSRVEGLSNADDYLGKPFELRELGARVDALLRRYTVPTTLSQEIRPPTSGISGNLEHIGGAMAALQMVSISQSAGGLTFGDRGTVYLLEGKVVHAQRPSDFGPSAAYYLLALEEGSFEFSPSLRPELETMNADPMMLMLDVSRVKDEAKQKTESSVELAPDDDDDLMIFEDILEPIDLIAEGVIVVPSIIAAKTLLEGSTLRVEERQDEGSGTVCLVFEGKGLRLAVLNATLLDYNLS
jgi:DNA-binding response OmpR family regulator